MPIPLLLAAAPAIAQTAGGIYQSLFSGRGKAIKDLELSAARNPIYRGSKPISDYYTEAKSRYGVSPYNSAQYQTAVRDAARGTATGINALQDRRSALGGIGKLVGIQNDKTQQAGVLAENQRNQRFGQLGTAAGMKSGDDRYKFQINELDPYNRRYSLASMKAGQASAVRDAGLSNIYGGLGNASMLIGGMKKTPQYGKKDNFDYLETIGD